MFFIEFRLIPERCQKIFCSTNFSAVAIQMIEEITNYPIKYLAELDNSISASIKQFCIHVAGEKETFDMMHKLCTIFENTDHQLIIFCKVSLIDQNLIFLSD